MEIIKEKYFEDEDGYKKETTYKSGLKEKILLEPSQKYIDEKIGPRTEAVERQREEEEKRKGIEEKFEKWKKEKFEEK